MKTVDEFDAPRLPKAPAAHCITMMSGATIQYCIYAVPAWRQVGAEFPYYLALISNRDDELITHFGFKDYAWCLERAYKLCLENVKGIQTDKKNPPR